MKAVDMGLFPVWTEYEGRGDLRLSDKAKRLKVTKREERRDGVGGWD